MIREGAKELRIFDEMKKLKTIEDKRIEEVLRQNFQENDTTYATGAHRTSRGRRTGPGEEQGPGLFPPS